MKKFILMLSMVGNGTFAANLTYARQQEALRQQADRDRQALAAIQMAGQTPVVISARASQHLQWQADHHNRSISSKRKTKKKK